MANDKKMRRGVQQALYKYLPGSWVDYTQSGGGVTYAVHVDNWNSIQLPGVNNKRLLRIVNQRVHEFISHSSEGEASVIDFATRDVPWVNALEGFYYRAESYYYIF